MLLPRKGRCQQTNSHSCPSGFWPSTLGGSFDNLRGYVALSLWSPVFGFRYSVFGPPPPIASQLISWKTKTKRWMPSSDDDSYADAIAVEIAVEASSWLAKWISLKFAELQTGLFFGYPCTMPPSTVPHAPHKSLLIYFCRNSARASLL